MYINAHPTEFSNVTTHTYSHNHTYTHARTYTHTHTLTHIHTHTHTSKQALPYDTMIAALLRSPCDFLFNCTTNILFESFGFSLHLRSKGGKSGLVKLSRRNVKESRRDRFSWRRSSHCGRIRVIMIIVVAAVGTPPTLLITLQPQSHL